MNESTEGPGEPGEATPTRRPADVLDATQAARAIEPNAADASADVDADVVDPAPAVAPVAAGDAVLSLVRGAADVAAADLEPIDSAIQRANIQLVETRAVSAVAAPPATPRTGQRAPDASPIDRVLDEPHRFEFHQAVRLIQRWQRQLPPEDRPALRYRNTLSLSFPASEIVEVETDLRGAAVNVNQTGPGRTPVPRRPAGSHDNLERIEITPAFLGLLGATGALPLSYSEQFAQRESVGRDGAARAFLDVFQHRAVSLFHEAWRKHRLPMQFEADRRERYLPLVLSLAGLGEPALRDRLRPRDGGVADDALAFYSGLLQRRAVSGSHLERVLADYFGVGARVTQFVGRWFELDEDCQITLGQSEARLGYNTLLGPRIWQRDLRVRLSFGPMTRAQHQRFLPGGPAALALRELLTLVSGVSLEYEVHLCIHAPEVVGATLVGSPQADGEGARLGWDSFLLSSPSVEDREEAVYDIHAMAA